MEAERRGLEADCSGRSNSKKTWEKLQGALWKLKDYEKTGLSPDQVSELQDETQEQARQMLERVARFSDEIERMKGEERQQ